MSSLTQKMFIIVGLLTSFGLIMVYSTTSMNPNAKFLVVKQIAAVSVGILAATWLLKFDLSILQRYSRYILLGSICLLLLVLIPGIGSKLNNARRWIFLGGISFQPSELAKIGILVYVADFLTRKQLQIKEFWNGFMPPVIVIGFCALLVIVEPDIGTAALMVVVLVAVLIVGGIRIAHMLMTGAVILPPALFIIAMKFSHFSTRWEIFQNPYADAGGKGYQIVQSLVALGSGGLTGVGLGMGQQKLAFLPESSSDFILAIIGEELGMIGALAVVLLFVMLMYYCFRIVRYAPSAFSGLMALGLSLFIGLQALINIAVVTASIPAKGIPLPFVSTGGTSVVFMFIAVGLLGNIGNQIEEKPVVAPAEGYVPLKPALAEE